MAGAKFKDVVDVYIVYISQFDFFGGNSPIYHIDKVIRETGKKVEDGSFEIFVNTAVKDGSDVSELMSCFLETNVNNPRFPKLSNRVKELKTTESEVEAMCGVVEKLVIQAYVEGALDYGATKEKIIDSLREKFDLSEQEATEQYDKYAPVTL